MSYGMQVLNSSGRVIFDTNVADSNYYSPAGVTTVSTYSADPSFSYNSSDILLARPESNESGAIFFSGLDYFLNGNLRFGGVGSAETGFKAANGVSYIYSEKQEGNVSLASSGYGLEVYTAAGNILYSSNIAANFEILEVGTMTDNTNYTWNMPAGYNFNDIFVTAASFSMLYIVITFPGRIDTLTGTFAYFDDTNERILIKQGSFTQSGQVYADTVTMGSYASDQVQNYMIVARLT